MTIPKKTCNSCDNFRKVKYPEKTLNVCEFLDCLCEYVINCKHWTSIKYKRIKKHQRKN